MTVFVRSVKRMEARLAPIREARQRREARELRHENILLQVVAEELALHNAFHRCRDEIHGDFSQAGDLGSLMRACRKALEKLGPDKHGPAKTWGVNVYRFSNRSFFLWSVAREKLQGKSRCEEPLLIPPGEKRYFINTGKDRGYPEKKTDILLIDRFADLEKMGPEDRAAAEADFERDLQSYFGKDYRIIYAGRLDQLRNALRYNFYVRWPGFDQYDAVIMANKHVRNAQRIKDDLLPEPLFHDKATEELTHVSLRGLQGPFTDELRKVENGRKAELRLLRGDALHKLHTALDHGQTPQQMFEDTLDLLPQLFPRTAEDSNVERASIMTFDEEEGRLSIVAARGLNEGIIKDTHLLPGENLAGRVFQTGKPILVLDAQAQQADVFLDRPSLAKIAPGACMSVPILSEGKTYGVLNVRSRRVKSFQGEELRFFETIAGFLADKMLRLSLQNQDELTGLLRRGPGVDKINNMLEVAFKRNIKLAFLMIDLNRFKRINDTYGHKAGDEAVRVIAGLIKNFIRSRKKEFTDHAEIRWGGDELVVSLLGANADQARKISEELYELIRRQPFDFLRKGDFITASFGVAIYPDHGTNLEAVAHNADKSAYTAKRIGTVVVFDPDDEEIRQTLLP